MKNVFATIGVIWTGSIIYRAGKIAGRKDEYERRKEIQNNVKDYVKKEFGARA